MLLFFYTEEYDPICSKVNDAKLFKNILVTVSFCFS